MQEYYGPVARATTVQEYCNPVARSPRIATTTLHRRCTTVARATTEHRRCDPVALATAHSSSLGSLLVPLGVALGVALGGPDLAVGLTAAVVPLVLLVTARALREFDAAARVPVTGIALLRAQPHLRTLPPAELEGVAAAMERRTYADGEVVVRQGEPGTAFVAVVDGRVAVTVDGVAWRTCTRPEGIGVIALLRSVPRSATVAADGPAVLHALPRETVLDVVTGHAGTARRVGVIAQDRLAGDPAPTE